MMHGHGNSNRNAKKDKSTPVTYRFASFCSRDSWINTEEVNTMYQ